MDVRSRKRLAILLQRVPPFERPRLELEQYVTPADVAASLLWEALAAGHVEGRLVADLGAGTGMLTAGALLLGAERVVAVEVDPSAASQLEATVAALGLDPSRVELRREDARAASVRADTVVQNPPFGVWSPHADDAFVEAAKRAAPVVYTLHKDAPGTSAWMAGRAAPTHRAEALSRVEMAIPPVHGFHRKRLYKVPVVLFRLTAR